MFRQQHDLDIIPSLSFRHLPSLGARVIKIEMFDTPALNLRRRLVLEVYPTLVHKSLSFIFPFIVQRRPV